MESDQTLRFFIFGDIGHAGPSRSLVADAAMALQAKWKLQKEEPIAQFVLTTGDNLYGAADDAAFECLQKEMLDKLPLPWYICLGNHDVKSGKYEWHNARDGMKGRTGWSWHCPGPAYTVPEKLTMKLIDLHVINTNKLSKLMPTVPPGPAPEFYISKTFKWWREQKDYLNIKLKNGNNRNASKNFSKNIGDRRWQVVVGHHPAEYVYLSLKEHGLWGIRYFPTTFMRGNPKHMLDRGGLAHILRKEADLYLCGHQHLSAYMKLSESGNRPKQEQRCVFAIVGNSSKLDQDDGDFDDDFFGGKAYQKEEMIAKRQLSMEKSNKDIEQIRIRSLSVPKNRRYAKEWSQAHSIGFAVAYVTMERFKFTFMEVYADGGYSESKYFEL